MVDIISVSEKILTALEHLLNSEVMALFKDEKVEELGEYYADKDSPLALLSFDVDKIKELVFASTKPLEINGASEIVNDLTMEKRAGVKLPACSVYGILEDFGLGSEHVLFAAGGTGLLLVPAKMVMEIAESIEGVFKRVSITGSLSIAYHTFKPHELLVGSEQLNHVGESGVFEGVELFNVANRSGGFGEILRLLADKLRQLKEEKMRMPVLNLPGYIKRCHSCGLQPASRYDRVEGAELNFLCESCFAHRNRGRDESRLTRWEVAKSIEDIVGEDSSRSYVAVVYADGNGMGRMLLQMKSMEDLCIFSRTVSEVIEEVRDELVSKHNLEKEYQAPVVGGDDIMLIIKASKSVKLVIDLLDLFKNKISERAEKLKTTCPELSSLIKNISLSVGFVIVPQHFNIRFTVDYAEQMLKAAKKGFRLKQKECIDFIVLTEGSPLSHDPQAIRDRFFVNKGSTWQVKLTRRPLDLEQFRQLCEDIIILKKNVSRHQLKYIQKLISTESPGVAALNLRYQWVRPAAGWKGFMHDNPKNHDLWMQKLLGEDQKRTGCYISSIADLMDLYTFVEA